MMSVAKRMLFIIFVGALSSVGIATSGNAQDAVRGSQWHLPFLRVGEVGAISQGDGVTVGVVDTGVDANHPDLTGAVLPGFDFLSGAPDGRRDTDGHGTKMAGLIAARGRPGGVGALGIAPMSRILPVRAGPSLIYQGGAGIEWAIDHGAKVICFASGGGSDRNLAAVVERASKADVVLVAAIGNRPDQVAPLARIPGVLVATGIDRSGAHSDFSVVASEAMLAAPATDIVGVALSGGYGIGSGTSDAAAIIAGAAALVRSKFPQLSAPEVIHRLTATAIDKGKPGRDDEYGYGIVDLVGALTKDVPPLTVSPTPRPSSPPKAEEPRKPTAPIGWVLAGILLAAAGAGALIAVRRVRRGGAEQ